MAAPPRASGSAVTASSRATRSATTATRWRATAATRTARRPPVETASSLPARAGTTATAWTATGAAPPARARAATGTEATAPASPPTCQREGGNGRRDGNEECDDGNTTNGDGCSSACKRECVADIDCDDGFACTTDTCVAGTCVSTSPNGFSGTLCVVKQLTADPACPGENVSGKLSLNAKVKRLQRLVRRASKGRNTNGLLRQAANVVAATQTKAGRLANQTKISADCADEGGGRLGEGPAVGTPPGHHGERE